MDNPRQCFNIAKDSNSINMEIYFRGNFKCCFRVIDSAIKFLEDNKNDIKKYCYYHKRLYKIRDNLKTRMATKWIIEKTTRVFFVNGDSKN